MTFHQCQARMRVIMGCLHFPKNTSVFHMYEAIIVNMILMQVL